jgi:uncharacterized protein (DUF1697 family)
MATDSCSVALLRGINVGKSVRIGMAELRAIFEQLGATDVRSYLQSGNVIFDGTMDVAALESAITERFGITPRVLILSSAEFHAVAAEIPIRELATDPSRGFVYFMDSVPPSLELPTDIGPEQLIVGRLAVYQWSPQGAGQSKIKASFIKSLGPTATARNLRTVDALLALLDD